MARLGHPAASPRSFGARPRQRRLVRAMERALHARAYSGALFLLHAPWSHRGNNTPMATLSTSSEILVRASRGLHSFEREGRARLAEAARDSRAAWPFDAMYFCAFCAALHSPELELCCSSCGRAACRFCIAWMAGSAPSPYCPECRAGCSERKREAEHRQKCAKRHEQARAGGKSSSS